MNHGRFDAGRIIDSFRVGSPRAPWGLGECFDAVDVETGRVVILKALRGAAGGAWRARTTERLATIGRLSISRVVPVIAWGLIDDDAWLATDPAAGERLASTLLDRPCPLDARSARQLVDRVAQTLASAHRHVPAVHHAGLSAESVIIEGPHGDVRLMDFGVGAIAPALLDVLPPRWNPRPPERQSTAPSPDLFGLAVLVLALLDHAPASARGPTWAQLADDSERAVRDAIAETAAARSPSLTEVLTDALLRRGPLADLDALRRELARADWSALELPDDADVSVETTRLDLSAPPRRFDDAETVATAHDGVASRDLEVETVDLVSRPRDNGAIDPFSDSPASYGTAPAGTWSMARTEPVPLDALVVPPAAANAEETLPPAFQWTTPIAAPPPPPPPPSPTAWVAPPSPQAQQSWPSFRPAPPPAPPPPPEPSRALVDGRGAFDRSFVQAAVVGVLVLSLLAVMLAAR